MSQGLQHTERLLGLFVESHPRATMDRLLSFLLWNHGAKGVLLCHVQEDQAVVEAARSMRPARIADFDAVWAEALPMLRAGEVLAGDDYVIAPLISRGNTMVGALFMDQPEKFEREGLDVYLLGLAQALLASRAAAPETTAGVSVNQRQLMLDVLEAHEWNLSRVARALGITRRTVYLRMERFGIQRKHVPKLAKPPV